ncbi:MULTISPECIES: hypothetical protein [Pontibacillus]|uniref:Uncharacterized protein n=1 Tax=Pontibacillus chungwhensis TaxID=265426 RepID=A0ABY8V0N9_9BACI|nr:MULTISPECIES: hypothetical protein [Pontibacillus]MCD5324349.1 hypothetical protein [Pontibacillus sp. HN14]WIF99352.1 hypothetical protein QNI29_06760 [Pontibacillus chungwhensis]
MNKNIQAFSIIFLGVCIVISSWFISDALKTKDREVVEKPNEKVQNENRYEHIVIVNDYFRIFDKQTGDYWESIGGGDWKKYTPLSNSNQQ